MPQLQYTTPGGIIVSRTLSKVPYGKGLGAILRQLDAFRGIYLSSGYEYPGRYSRWDVAAVKPPLEIVAAAEKMEFRALNERGRVLLTLMEPVLAGHPHWEEFGFDGPVLRGRLKPLPGFFSEEERSKQPSAFSILRALMHEFQHAEDPHLGLIGAFGFDLLFRFDPIELKLPRADVKDLHLFLCDEIYLMDRKKEVIERYRYEFTRGGQTTTGLARDGERVAKPPKRKPAPITADHTPEEYMRNVETVRAGMKQGDYYEVVLRQTFKTVPRELDEAARVEGCTPLQVLWKVYVPLARPTYLAYALVSVSYHWNNFLWPLIITNSVESRPVTVGLQVFASTDQGIDWSIITAATLLTTAPLLVAFLLFQRQFVASFMRAGIR